MAQKPVIEVRGIKELNRALRKLGDDLPDTLKTGFLAIAQRHVSVVANSLPRRGGRLASSVRAGASKRAAVIRTGKASVPYAGPVEFGGWPRGRPFVPGGRYIFPAARALETPVFTAADRLIDEAIAKAGL